MGHFTAWSIWHQCIFSMQGSPHYRLTDSVPQSKTVPPLTLAPWSSRILTTLTCPLAAAEWRGVNKFLSLQFTSASLSISSWTTSTWPAKENEDVDINTTTASTCVKGMNKYHIYKSGREGMGLTPPGVRKYLPQDENLWDPVTVLRCYLCQFQVQMKMKVIKILHKVNILQIPTVHGRPIMTHSADQILAHAPHLGEQCHHSSSIEQSHQERHIHLSIIMLFLFFLFFFFKSVLTHVGGPV